MKRINRKLLDLLSVLGIALFMGVLMAIGSCGPDTRYINNPDVPDPQVCLTQGGRSLPLNEVWVQYWAEGYRCTQEYNRDGEAVDDPDCKFGVLSTPISADHSHCMDIVDAPALDPGVSDDLGEITWGLWTVCGGYQSGEGVLTEDLDLDVPVTPDSYCEFSVPQCKHQPDAHWGEPFSDGRIVIEAVDVSLCCQFPGAEVQEVCNCPPGRVVCDIGGICECNYIPVEDPI